MVKNAIIQIDATPFRQWYLQHYGVEVGLKKKLGAANVAGDEKQVGVPSEVPLTGNNLLLCVSDWRLGLDIWLGRIGAVLDCALHRVLRM